MSTTHLPFVRYLGISVTLTSLLIVHGCGIPVSNPSLHAPGPTLPATDTLKVHTHDGDLYVLSSWQTPDTSGVLAGFGTRYDPNRSQVSYGEVQITAVDIALLEANNRETVARFAMAGLSTLTTLSAFVTAACMADPKSCFGSCPTFYTPTDQDRPLAEGFSASFAKALEARDIDHLGLTASSGPTSLIMRNEALETHAVRHVRLIAVPRIEDHVTLPTPDGELVGIRSASGPLRCQTADVDCLAQVETRDDDEFASLTSAHDLGVREEVVLDFETVAGDAALVLTARNSFVTTYVFYQALAYAGRRTGELLAALERGEPGVEEQVLGVQRALGGIEVLVASGNGTWEVVGRFDEAGPIAADRQALPLGRYEAGPLRVKLRMAKGSWRIDEAAVAVVGAEVEPITLEPDSVTPLSDRAGSRDPRPFDHLVDPGRHLVTVPGDAHRIWFTVPEGGSHELFLDTEGYYYEWVRDEWLEDESIPATAQLLFAPDAALEAMAPGFKEIESTIEQLFWSSRFRGR